MTSSSEETLANRWIVVGGGSKGIGLEIANRLARDGAHLVLVARDKRALEDARIEVLSNGAADTQVLTVVADTSKEEDVARLESVLREQVPAIHGLIANAGTGGLTPFLELDLKEWDRIISTNLRGTFQLCQMAARLMVEQRANAQSPVKDDDFSLLVVSSIRAWQYRLGTLPYSTTKAGLQQFVRGVALELAPHRIRVNSLAPGMTVTPLMLESSPDVVEHAAQKIPFGRAGEPIDMSRAATFLLSPAASFITGSTLTVDGGESLV